MNLILDQLNQIFANPTTTTIKNAFIDNAYIRLNMIHISPYTLLQLKKKLEFLGMQKWLFNSEGIDFKFNNFNINFKGNLKVCYINKIQNNILPKIFSIELDFEPLIPQEMVHLLLEIENYLKSADSIFFMSYFINTDFEILNNDLSHSISSVMRQVKMKRRKDESNQE